MAMEHMDALRQMKRNRPFTPFRIVTTGGERYLVEDRFQFAVAESKVLYSRPASQGLVRLTPDGIAAVETAKQEPAA